MKIQPKWSARSVEIFGGERGVDYHDGYSPTKEGPMDLGDMMDKAKAAAKHVSDEQIQQARDVIDDKVDDTFDGALDAVANQAKKFID